ncbi:MAG: phage tail tape measure protein [Oscillospiraceae bacterium]|nr:phage tail tape measure protein [Oscillospiraceae bacterium]MDD7278282.1 phage tail tape measure protein [Oscillospiraceae bacterium]MDY2863418.1 phage tail tape measure protein [Oscillospiraceae bacterium]
MNDGDLIFNTRINTEGFQSGLSEIQQQTRGLSGTTQTALGTLAANAAMSVANAVKDAFTEAASYVVETGKSFEASMSQVTATMGLTTASEEYEVLSAAAKEMGATTKYSATQAGEALNYLALAGYSAENSVKALPTVLNVAAAGGIDLAYASDMITDSMSALGLEMSDLTGFSDKLAKTSQKSNTSVAQLGEAILTVGGTAKSLAGGVDELNTMLGLIADNGIKGAEGGTALRNIILSLSAPTDTAAAALKELNVQAFDSDGNLRELSDVFGDLNTALAPLTDEEKTQFLNKIFNKVDLKAVNALLGTTSTRFDELRGYIEDCDGAAAQMAETMSDNLEGDMQILNSSLEAVGVSTYEKFSGPMREAVQEITGIFDELNEKINGELGDKLETLAEKLGDVAVQAAEFAVDEGIPKLIDALGWICDHGDELLNAAETAGAMVIAYKGLSAANTAVTAIKNTAAAMSTAATAAEGLGIAMNAVPWVALITLAVGAGVAIKNQWEREKELIGYEGELAEKYKETNKQLAIRNNLFAEQASSDDVNDRRQAYITAKKDYEDYAAQIKRNNENIAGLKKSLDFIDARMDPNAFTNNENAIKELEDQNIILEAALYARKQIIEKYSDFDNISPEHIMNQDIIDEQGRNAQAVLDKYRQQTAAQLASQEALNQELADKWAELDHKYAMGIIATDDDLYTERLALLAEYGDESSKDHWKYYEQIHSYEKQQNEKRLEEDKKRDDERKDEEEKRFNESKKSLENNLNDLNSIYKEKYSELENMQSDYRSRLMAIGGDVFTVETKTDDDGGETKEFKINDIEAQMVAMRSYHEDIKKLKEDGASAALLSEINALSTEDAMGMADYIAGLSEEERKQVIELYKQKEAVADELSADLYAKDAQNMQDAFAKAMTDMGVSAFDSGVTAAEQWASGFNGTLSELIDVSAIVNKQSAAASSASSETGAGGNNDTNVNVDVTVTGGNLTLDGNAMGEYNLDYDTQVNTQKGR